MVIITSANSMNFVSIPSHFMHHLRAAHISVGGESLVC
jgi:hypothetical protein